MKEPEARTVYLAMGPGRSLDKLHRNCTESGLKVGRSTLAVWSRKHGWPALAAEHDAKVGAKVEKKLAEREANTRAAVAGKYLDFSSDAIDQARAALAGADSVKEIIEAAVAATKQSEVMTGGVSDRQQRVEGEEEEAAKVQREAEEILIRVAAQYQVPEKSDRKP
jgi:hypothetical protein